MKSLNDLTAPAPVERKLLEADVQEKCVEWARRRGYWARKFSSISQRSVPDYLFAKETEVGYADRSTERVKIKFACEFKAPGKIPTDNQFDEMRAMREAGWRVFFADSFETFQMGVKQAEADHVS